MKIKLLVLFIISLSIVNYTYVLKNKEKIYHIQLKQRADIILNAMELYKEKNGAYPKDLSCCFKLKVSKTKEMEEFLFDNDDSLAFIYMRDAILDDYLLILGDYYPPNLIYIFKTGEFDFNSTIISDFGL